MDNKEKSKKLLVDALVLAFIVGGVFWVGSRFFFLSSSSFTDNAQVRQNKVALTSKVPGFIKEIRYTEFSHVCKGDTLVIIEDSEFKLALAQAEAAYANALAGKEAMGKTIKTTKNNVGVTGAAIEEVKVNLDNAQANYVRFKNLYEKGAVTRQQFECVETQYNALKARYEMMKGQQQSVKLGVGELGSRLDQTEAGLAVAEAALNLARLNLSYTVITAPCDGYTGRRDVQVGELVQPGRILLNLVDEGSIWVLANYREKQLKNVAVGDKVVIKVDAVPGVEFKGYVESISAATGAQFSLVPQDNSTGNFVKVEQRVPVNIAFSKDNKAEDMALLRDGFNAECKVTRK